ncbi:MAG: response regulator transcription factor [Chloroflexi bacterium]|nr:response regulator transcription factor [Chloroflexota bacterium]
MSDPSPRVLVVDDEAPIRKFLRASLTAHGYLVFEAATGAQALDAVVSHQPDLVILDLGLPDMDGLEVTRRLREWSQVPIVVLSVREHETDKVQVLDAGADDYVTKPFGIAELLARMRAAIRHAAQPAGESVFTTGDLVMDLGRRLVTVGGKEIQLTPTEYGLLRALATNADKVLTHHQLLRLVWGAAFGDETHILRVNISNLRRKIESDPTRPRYIITEPGVGYRLRAEL